MITLNFFESSPMFSPKMPSMTSTRTAAVQKDDRIALRIMIVDFQTIEIGKFACSAFSQFAHLRSPLFGPWDVDRWSP